MLMVWIVLSKLTHAEANKLTINAKSQTLSSLDRHKRSLAIKLI